MCVCTLVSADSLWASSPCSPPVMKTQHRNTLSSTFTWGSDQARLLFLQGLCLFLSLCSNSVLLWNQRPHPVQDLPIRTARGRKQPAAGFKWNNGGKNIRKQVVPPQVKRWSPFSAWWSSDSEKKTLLDEMNWNSKTQFYKRNLASSTFHRLVSSPFLCRDKGHVVSMWINREQNCCGGGRSRNLSSPVSSGRVFLRSERKETGGRAEGDEDKEIWSTNQN